MESISILPNSFYLSHGLPCEKYKTCLWPFVRYFRTLFWDDNTIIYWWKLSKQYFHPKLSRYHPKITYENIVQKDMNIEQVYKCMLMMIFARDEKHLDAGSSDSNWYISDQHYFMIEWNYSQNPMIFRFSEIKEIWYQCSI